MRQLGFILIIAGVALLAKALPTFFDGSWLGWAITVPGVFMHELAHYGFALLLGANPSGFSIFPSFEDGSMVSYGHVLVSPSWWNAATIALAPILVAPASVWVMLVTARLPLVLKPVGVWAAAAGFYSATPSGADWTIAMSAPVSFVVAIPILGFCCYLWYRLIRIEVARNLRS